MCKNNANIWVLILRWQSLTKYKNGLSNKSFDWVIFLIWFVMKNIAFDLWFEDEYARKLFSISWCYD